MQERPGTTPCSLRRCSIRTLVNKIDGARESLTSARSRLGDVVVPDDLLEALCVAVLAFRGKDTQ